MDNSRLLNSKYQSETFTLNIGETKMVEFKTKSQYHELVGIFCTGAVGYVTSSLSIDSNEILPKGTPLAIFTPSSVSWKETYHEVSRKISHSLVSCEFVNSDTVARTFNVILIVR